MKVFGHGTTSGFGVAINTPASFLELASLGVDGVELDIRRSLDDRLVVVHDDRYLDGRLVVETPAADRPADVILLPEALDLCVGLEVNIELKNLPNEEIYDSEQRIADVHERHRAVHPYVSMVDEAFMRRARELGLRVNVWSAEHDSADEVRALIDLGVDGLITESPQQAIQVRDVARPHDD